MTVVQGHPDGDLKVLASIRSVSHVLMKQQGAD